MKKPFSVSLVLVLVVSSAVNAQGSWQTIYESDLAVVQIDTTGVLRGPNGAVLVNLLRVYTEPQASFSGTMHQYALSRVEYDCTGRRHWLHEYWLGMNEQTVEHKQYENPTPLKFLPEGTLAGDTALAVCNSLRSRPLNYR